MHAIPLAPTSVFKRRMSLGSNNKGGEGLANTTLSILSTETLEALPSGPYYLPQDPSPGPPSSQQAALPLKPEMRAHHPQSHQGVSCSPESARFLSNSCPTFPACLWTVRPRQAPHCTRAPSLVSPQALPGGPHPSHTTRAAVPACSGPSSNVTSLAHLMQPK